MRAERLVHGGAALVRTPAGVAFVDGAIPGELVVVGPVARRGSTPVASLLDIVEPSPDRVQPLCPLFGTCGGCDWQHLSIDSQRRWKREIVAENARRLGGVSVDAAEIGLISGPGWGYRSRVQIHGGDDGAAGFRRRRSSDVVPVGYCPVATPAINVEIGSGAPVRPGSRTVLVESARGIARSDRDREAHISLDGTDLRFHPGGFAQANHGLLPALAAAIRAAVYGDTIADLHAGAGLLAAMASMPPATVRKAVCVEPDRRNADLIRENLTSAAPSTTVSVFTGTAERAVARNAVPRSGECTVILDPPRGGVSGQLRRWLVAPRTAIPRVVYLSCDAAALGRDLGALRERYRIDSLTVFDFYPQTAHIETLAILSAEGS